jgi:hypothetical protein
MKTLLIAIATLLTAICNGQIARTETAQFIKVGEFKSGPLNGALKYSVIEQDTTYHLLFQNANYRTIIDIKSFAFRNENNTIDTLYNLLSDALKADKGNKVSFQLGEDNVTVMTDAVMGIKYVNVLRPADGALLTLTQKQLKKLFNK